VREFRPETAGLTAGIDPAEIPPDLKFCRFLSGAEALRAAAAETDADCVLVSIVGIAGLQGVLDALNAGKQVLLANKEALVTGGRLVTELARKTGKPLLPVDPASTAPFFSVCRARGTIPRKKSC
jgi:1-deoxy-D-xylulose 5-phosphate reductoisomerase